MNVDQNTTLADLRRQIDSLDRTIIDALARRFEITAHVAATKNQGRTFRPGREADLIGGLLKASQGAVDPRLIETLWRQIIAFSLAGQKQLSIAHSGGDEIAQSARYRFGEVARYDHFDNTAALFDAVADGQVDLGVLPHWDDGDWWRDLVSRRKAGSALAIVAVTPLNPDSPIRRSVVIADYMPDPSATDMTIIHENGTVITRPGHHPDHPDILGIFQQH